MMQTRTLAFVPALSIVMALCAPSAHALMMMRIDDPSTAGVDIEISDTDGDGFLLYSGIVGSWISVSGGFGAPAIGSDSYDALDLFSVDVSGRSGTLEISLTQTDFSRTSAHFVSGVGGTTDGRVSFATYLGASNTLFDTATLLSDLGEFSGAFADTDSKQIDQTGPYSLTMVATVHHAGARQISSFDYISKIPEPGPLALFGVGLVALATVRRRVTS